MCSFFFFSFLESSSLHLTVHWKSVPRWLTSLNFIDCFVAYASSLSSCTHLGALCIAGWCCLQWPPLLEHYFSRPDRLSSFFSRVFDRNCGHSSAWKPTWTEWTQPPRACVWGSQSVWTAEQEAEAVSEWDSNAGWGSCDCKAFSPLKGDFGASNCSCFVCENVLYICLVLFNLENQPEISHNIIKDSNSLSEE